MNKFISIVNNFTRIHFIEMSLACQLVTVVSLYAILLKLPIETISLMLFIGAAPISFIFGLLGIIFDEHKLLAIAATCVAGIPTFFIIYNSIERLRHR